MIYRARVSIKEGLNDFNMLRDLKTDTFEC